jgi:hypothetical protein
VSLLNHPVPRDQIRVVPVTEKALCRQRARLIEVVAEVPEAEPVFGGNVVVDPGCVFVEILGKGPAVLDESVPAGLTEIR